MRAAIGNDRSTVTMRDQCFDARVAHERQVAGEHEPRMLRPFGLRRGDARDRPERQVPIDDDAARRDARVRRAGPDAPRRTPSRNAGPAVRRAHSSCGLPCSVKRRLVAPHPAARAAREHQAMQRRQCFAVMALLPCVPQAHRACRRASRAGASRRSRSRARAPCTCRRS